MKTTSPQDPDQHPGEPDEAAELALDNLKGELSRAISAHEKAHRHVRNAVMTDALGLPYHTLRKLYPEATDDDHPAPWDDPAGFFDLTEAAALVERIGVLVDKSAELVDRLTDGFTTGT